MKKCPLCQKDISLLASKCRFCDADLNNVQTSSKQKDSLISEEKTLKKEKELLINNSQKNKQVYTPKKIKLSLKIIIGFILIFLGVFIYLKIQPTKIKDVDAFFQLNKSEIIKILGEPKILDGYLYEYEEDGLRFIFDDQQVTAIILFTDNYYYQNTKTGMRFDQIKTILGNPLYEGYDEQTEMDILVYQFDKIEAYYYQQSNYQTVDFISIINKTRISD